MKKTIATILLMSVFLVGCRNTAIDQFEQRLLCLDNLSYRLQVEQSGKYPDGRIYPPRTIVDVQVTQDRQTSNVSGKRLDGCSIGTSEHPWIGKGNVSPMVDMMRRADNVGMEGGLHKYILRYGDDEFRITHTFWLGEYLVKWRTTQQSNEKNDTGRVTRTRTYSNYKGVKK